MTFQRLFLKHHVIGVWFEQTVDKLSLCLSCFSVSHWHCCQIVLFLLSDQLFHIVKCVCVCVCMYVCMYMYVCIYIYMHARADWVEIVYELLLLPKNAASETYLHKSGAVRGVNGYLSLGYRPGGDWTNMWLSKTCFTIFVLSRK
jgi:hypothetical protein